RVRLFAPRALRAARRTGGEDDDLALLGRRARVLLGAGGDQLLERRVRHLLARIGPGDEGPAAAGARGEQVRELGVVDDRRRPLALEDVGDLRPGERRA